MKKIILLFGLVFILGCTGITGEFIKEDCPIDTTLYAECNSCCPQDNTPYVECNSCCDTSELEAHVTNLSNQIIIKNNQIIDLTNQLEGNNQEIIDLQTEIKHLNEIINPTPQEPVESDGYTYLYDYYYDYYKKDKELLGNLLGSEDFAYKRHARYDGKIYMTLVSNLGFSGGWHCLSVEYNAYTGKLIRYEDITLKGESGTASCDRSKIWWETGRED